jgi:hypothetical protein
MEYDEAVARGRALLTRSEKDQWELAKLTYEVALRAEWGGLTRWAERLGVSLPHVTNLRNVWDRYGNLYLGKDLSNRTFTELYKAARIPLRDDDQERRDNEGRGHQPGDRDASRERRERVKQARESLTDREVMREALRDRKARSRFREIFEDEFGRPEQAPAPKPPARRSPHKLAGELLDLRDRLNRMLFQTIHVDLSPEVREAMLEELDRLENSLGWMRSFLESGDTTFEEALEEILKEGDAGPPAPPKARPTRPRQAPKPREAPAPAAPVAEQPEPTVEEPVVEPPVEPEREKPVREQRSPRGRKDPATKPSGRGRPAS